MFDLKYFEKLQQWQKADLKCSRVFFFFSFNVFTELDLFAQYWFSLTQQHKWCNKRRKTEADGAGPEMKEDTKTHTHTPKLLNTHAHTHPS